MVFRRDTGVKECIKFGDLRARVQDLLEDIQRTMYTRACILRDDNIETVTEWNQFLPALNAKSICLCAWCDTPQCEEAVKKRSAAEGSESGGDARGFKLTGAAKTLCIPFEQKEMKDNTICFACARQATKWTLFGRSY